MQEKHPNGLIALDKNITVIVITGGPCSGKTTGIAQLHRLLSDRGYKVLISPESATKLIMAGMNPGELLSSDFQKFILEDTLAQEEIIFSIAVKYRDAGSRVVVLCDRGAMDGAAYMGKGAYSSLIADMGYHPQELCEERYHAVIHMRTAAMGAEEHYSHVNNNARTETPSQARLLDQKTLDAWTRHPHPRVIDNRGNFEDKLRRLLIEICGVLGDPVPLEKEDKFLIQAFDPQFLTFEWYGSDIIQQYLVSPSPREERRIRMRKIGDNATYYYTTKQLVSVGIRTEDEKIITKREYETLATLRDPKKRAIEKRRVCFFWKEQFFEVDFFRKPDGLVVMEVERTDKTPKLELPPFIKVIRDVTGVPEYSNAEIARCVTDGI